MYDHETLNQFIRLRALGKSIRHISKTMKISKNTIYKWNTEYGGRIAEARRSLIDLTLTDAGAGRLDRIKATANVLSRVQAKLLHSTDSNELPDRDLLASYIRLCQLLDAVDAPVVDKRLHDQTDDEIMHSISMLRRAPEGGEFWIDHREKKKRTTCDKTVKEPVQ